MKSVNQLLNYKFRYFEYASLILFIILPISFVFGNGLININIALLNLMGLYYCFKFKNWNLIKNDLFLYLLILYLYLLGNSIYAHYFKFYSGFEGILRSLFFIKFIFLTLSFQIILKNKILLNVVYKGWLIIILIFIFDVLFEKIFGANILGYISPDGLEL